MDDDLDERLQRARAELDSGKVVACPTENSFGLLVRVDDPDAISRLGRVKPRTSLKGTGLILPNLLAWDRVAEVEPVARRLAAAFWPGPLSIVQPALPTLDIRLCLEGTVSVRLPAPSLAARLAEATGVSLTATSANLTGQAPILQSSRIRNVFSAYVRSGDLWVVEGTSPGGPPSTLVTFRQGVAQVLREGAVGSEAVFAALTSPGGT